MLAIVHRFLFLLLFLLCVCDTMGRSYQAMNYGYGLDRAAMFSACDCERREGRFLSVMPGRIGPNWASCQRVCGCGRDASGV